MKPTNLRKLRNLCANSINIFMYVPVALRIGQFCEPTKVIAAIEISVRKVAPSPPWSRKARCLRLSLENRAVSALVWEVAPPPHWPITPIFSSD